MADSLGLRHAEDQLSALPRPRRLPAWTPSTRLRLLGWYMGLLALALLAGLVLQRSILLSQLDDDVNAALRQEVEEMQQLSSGSNPATGLPFGNDVAAIFDTFLRRNIPVENEALFTLIDGKRYASTVTPLQLLDDPEVLRQWSAITRPTQAEIDTEAGEVRYLAVPVVPEAGPVGTFIVAIFLEPRRAEVNEVIQTGGFIFGSIFLIASVLAWFAAGRVLRPVSLLTETAISIKDDDWSRRIPVEGTDDIARLTRTFNDMLDRLETAFANQRNFIDDASHELKTPITIIRGHLEVMDDTAPEERAEVKRLVLDELGRMSRIVEDLLLLARAQQLDFLETHPFDTEEFMEDILVKASALSAERHWQLARADAAVVNADRQRLTQALMNLARNAVQHSEPGTSIILGCEAVGDELRLWVRDEGSGIAPADQQRIFERFSRGSGARRSEGAGLGLAIVKTIAEAHGGRVELSSVLGQGSTFLLVLPIEEEEPR